MAGAHYDSYSYYRCSNHYGHHRCGNAGATNETHIEKYLLENVEKLLNEHVVSVESIESNTKTKKSNRKTIEKKMQKLNDLYVNDFIDMDKYKQEYELLKSQIVDEPEEQKKDLTALKDFLGSNFKDVYKTLTIVEKQALWRSVIKEIRIRKREIVSVVFL
jgi:hypothetical protein